MSTNYYLINKKAWKRYNEQLWFIYDFKQQFIDQLGAEIGDSIFFTKEECHQIVEAFEQKLELSRILPAPKFHIGVSYCKENQVHFMSDIDPIQSKGSFWETILSLCDGKLENYAIIDEYHEVVDWDSFKQLLER